VLVVEDSATVRARICAVLNADAGLEVVGEAADGKAGIQKCRELRPDVITMDMMMPLMSGLSATEYVMAHCPTPILIVSSSVNRGELFKTYEALSAGAVDVLDKPVGDDSDADWERRLVAAVKMVARIRVITHPRGRLAERAERNGWLPTANSEPVSVGRGSYDLVAIGASTGGPGALVDVLSALPSSFALPILLVLHIGARFGPAFAEWLDGQSERRVVYASEGMPVDEVDGVAMAPPERHLVVRNGRLHLTDDPERHSCRPSVDVLFESIAADYGDRAAACILTGMGRDGASGLALVRECGGLTIGQDEASCVVYGMPREAALLGAVEHVLPLNEIGPSLGTLTDARQAAHR
jgi:two-component system chemotaxis response regulator CheB